MRKYSVGVFLNLFSDNTDDWSKQMEEIHNLGNVEHIEILIEYVPKKQQERELLASLVKKYKVILHAPFMDLSLLSPHPEIVQAAEAIFLDAIALGNYLSAELMTVHAERYPIFWDPEKAKGQLVKSLKRLLKSSLFPLAIENLSYSGKTQLAYPQTPEQIKDLASILPDNVGITIDTGHLLKDGYSVYQTAKAVKDLVLNFHLHDGYKGAAHLQLGEGEINTLRFLSFLTEIKYRHFVSLEVVGKQQIHESWKLLKEHLLA